MRARVLGIVLVALAVAAGCGDDADDAGDAGEVVDERSTTSTSTSDDGRGGDGDRDGDRDRGDEGGGRPWRERRERGDLAVYEDAEALAAALGCADSFEVEEPFAPDGPFPTATSAGFCSGGSTELSFEVYDEDDADRARAAFDLVTCELPHAPGFTWLAGGNWLLTPRHVLDPAEADRLAELAGGELLRCPE